MTQILLFRNGYHNLNKNFQIITGTIKYILSGKSFDEPLLWNCIFAPLIFGSWWTCSVGFVYVQVTSANVSYHRVGIYLFKVSNGKTRTMCEICSKLTIKTLEWCHRRRSDVYIDEFWISKCQVGMLLTKSLKQFFYMGLVQQWINDKYFKKFSYLC